MDDWGSDRWGHQIDGSGGEAPSQMTTKLTLLCQRWSTETEPNQSHKRACGGYHFIALDKCTTVLEPLSLTILAPSPL